MQETNPKRYINPIQINEDDNPDIEILAVRDLNSEEYSNSIRKQIERSFERIFERTF